MSDDYLWDGAGEADAEIARLEQTLSRFRYQDRQFALPATRRRWRPQRSFIRLIAVAAALVLMAAAIETLWHLRALNEQPIRTPTAVRTRPILPAINQTPITGEDISPSRHNSATLAQSSDTQKSHRRKEGSRLNFATSPQSVAINKRPVATGPRETTASAEEGARAKEKLLLALYIAGAELRDVQKKVYGRSMSFAPSATQK